MSSGWPPNPMQRRGLPPHLRCAATQILVDDVPTTVRISPTNTRFVGVVPKDVPTEAISASLQDEGFNF